MKTIAITAITAATLALAPVAQADDFNDCGDNTFAGPATSCPFAIDVHTAWLNSPGDQVEAYSTAAGRPFVMDCAAVANGGDVCRGGDNAVVVFNR